MSGTEYATLFRVSDTFSFPVPLVPEALPAGAQNRPVIHRTAGCMQRQGDDSDNQSDAPHEHHDGNLGWTMNVESPDNMDARQETGKIAHSTTLNHQRRTDLDIQAMKVPKCGLPLARPDEASDNEIAMQWQNIESP